MCAGQFFDMFGNLTPSRATGWAPPAMRKYFSIPKKKKFAFGFQSAQYMWVLDYHSQQHQQEQQMYHPGIWLKNVPVIRQSTSMTGGGRRTQNLSITPTSPLGRSDI